MRVSGIEEQRLAEHTLEMRRPSARYLECDGRAMRGSENPQRNMAKPWTLDWIGCLSGYKQATDAEKFTRTRRRPRLI